jgi:hypothetical protein
VLSLRELQGAFWDALGRAPGAFDPAACDPRLLALVAPSPTLDPADRLHVYADMYFWRILDALREDYPRVAALLGEDAWPALVREYLARHPSTHPSLRHAGRALADFVAATTGPGAPPWLADLARLEWARVEAFDAPDATPLGLVDLQRLPADDWPRLAFTPVPSLAVVVSDWPVDRVWKDEPADAPERTALRVWRREWRVWHARMTPAEERALAGLCAGDTFAALCEAFERPEDAGVQLLRWLEDGLLAGAAVA